MAKRPISNVDQTIAQGDAVGVSASSNAPSDENLAKDDSKSHPVYKKYPESRIPVPKSMGTLWKSRFDQGVTKLKTAGTWDAWDENVQYYKNDQTNKRNRDDPDRPSLGSEKDIAGGAFSRTENIVFANVSALVPSIYAKNPDVSVQSSKGEEEREFALTAQKLVRTIMQKRTPPGVNLKPKARVGVVRTTLMNISYLEVGYTQRDVSSDSALQEIDKIATNLAKAKDQKTIVELEGQLEAMNETIDLLQPSGPWCRAVHPKDIIIDPDATLPDLSDAKWVMVHDVLDTSFINAIYRTKDPETGQWTSLYKPTHVLKRDGNTDSKDIGMTGHDSDIKSFSLFTYDDDQKQGYNDYGYDDERSYRRAQRTFVWRVWDKTTRRVLMFAENDWSWPVWVWDDPYGLDDFFMQFPLAFHTDPEDMFARGEVSYYLDQQDEINLINSQISRMRWRISNQLVANKRAVKDEQSIMSLLKPVKGQEIVTVDIPEGMKISDVITAPPIPSVEYAQLFDKSNLLEAIDRVSGVSAVLRNVEFKTNTTNKAIDTYESSTQQRLDEKIDAIEEQIGRVGYAILCTCLQFMSQEEVAKLIGQEAAQYWPPSMTAREAQDSYNLTVTGGSSLKPTSKVRKAQAQEVGQILGQFGQASPLAFFVALKMFARAYSDELVLDPQDWQLISDAMAQQLGLAPGPMNPQQQQAPPPGGPQPPQQGGPPAEAPSAPGGGGGGNVVDQISQMIASMPDEIRQKFGAAIAQGIPLPEILAQLQQAAQGGQQGGPPQQPPTMQ
jgi:hypothetical protein